MTDETKELEPISSEQVPGDDSGIDVYASGDMIETQTGDAASGVISMPELAVAAYSPESDAHPFARNNVSAKEHGGFDKKKLAIGLVIGLLSALAIVYGGAAYYFSSHFGFNTTINDVDCSFMTVDEVTQVVRSQVDDYTLTVLTRDGGKETIGGDEIDLEYVEDGQVQALLDEQNPLTWIASVFQNPDAHTMHATVSYDDAKLDSIIEGLDCMQAANMTAPTDAYAEFDGVEWVIQPETLGTTLVSESVYPVLEDAVVNTMASIDLDEAGCYLAPEVTSESEDLKKQVDIYNKYVPFTITYTFGDQSEVLDGPTLMSFLDVSEDGSTATVDEEAVRAWLRDFGKRHDTIGTERTFIGGDGEEHTVSGGSYGWETDEDAEFDAIVEAFNNKVSIVRDPIYVQEAASFSTPDWGDSWIDLNLTKQHIWVYVDGAVVFEADVVTGLPIPSRQTSPGVWSVLEMKRNKVLKGELTAEGVPEYETPVSYWIRMTWTGMGFHDASWQPYFGGTRYQTAGSHGCINMSYADVQTLYGIAWVGMPIVSHY